MKKRLKVEYDSHCGWLIGITAKKSETIYDHSRVSKFFLNHKNSVISTLYNGHYRTRAQARTAKRIILEQMQ